MRFQDYILKRKGIRLLGDAVPSESLKYHIERGIPLHENVFRAYSPAYISLIEEARRLYDEGNIALTDEDADLIESDIGSTAFYLGREVMLDAPFPLRKRIDEADYKGKKVNIGKPFRTSGESKKFAVYVKDPKTGNIKKIRFGDPKLTVKNDNPARAKSFRARHKCSEKKDRMKAGYWACRIGRYAKSVGLKSNNSW